MQPGTAQLACAGVFSCVGTGTSPDAPGAAGGTSFEGTTGTSLCNDGTALSMTLSGACAGLLARYASPRLVMKKAVASTAVVRLRKLADPDEPNTLPAPPAPPPPPPPPNAAPASAPLPCCISTRPTVQIPTTTWIVSTTENR